MQKFQLIGSREIKTKHTDWPQDGDDNYGMEVEADDVSDGYHTMHELYQHRMALFVAVTKYASGLSWRSKKHSDKTMFDGYFVVGLRTRKGEQITYHYKMQYWDKFEHCVVLDSAPEYDGHKSSDVIERLMSL